MFFQIFIELGSLRTNFCGNHTPQKKQVADRLRAEMYPFGRKFQPFAGSFGRNSDVLSFTSEDLFQSVVRQAAFLSIRKHLAALEQG